MNHTTGARSAATTPTARLRALGYPPSPSELAIAAFLARYSGATREHYAVVLHVLFDWCADLGVEPLDATRQQLEQWARYLESDRRDSPSTVAGYLSIVRGFYRCAYIDERIDRSPADYLRSPRVFLNKEGRTWLNRSEFGAVLSASRESHVMDWALVSMGGLLGLRISEALSVRIEDFQDVERGHRVLRIVGKGSKAASIPLPPLVQRPMDAAAGTRESGPLLLRPHNTTMALKNAPMSRRSASAIITRLVRSCGVETAITPHSLRRSFITNLFAAGVPLVDIQRAARHSDPRQTMAYDMTVQDFDSHANYLLAAHLAPAA